MEDNSGFSIHFQTRTASKCPGTIPAVLHGYWARISPTYSRFFLFLRHLHSSSSSTERKTTTTEHTMASRCSSRYRGSTSRCCLNVSQSAMTLPLLTKNVLGVTPPFPSQMRNGMGNDGGETGAESAIPIYGGCTAGLRGRSQEWPRDELGKQLQYR